MSPPSSMTVPEPDRRPVLYDSEGKPLIRKPAGFNTDPPKPPSEDRKR